MFTKILTNNKGREYFKKTKNLDSYDISKKKDAIFPVETSDGQIQKANLKEILENGGSSSSDLVTFYCIDPTSFPLWNYTESLSANIETLFDWSSYMNFDVFTNNVTSFYFDYYTHHSACIFSRNNFSKLYAKGLTPYDGIDLKTKGYEVSELPDNPEHGDMYSYNNGSNVILAIYLDIKKDTDNNIPYDYKGWLIGKNDPYLNNLITNEFVISLDNPDILNIPQYTCKDSEDPSTYVISSLNAYVTKNSEKRYLTVTDLNIDHLDITETYMTFNDLSGFIDSLINETDTFNKLCSINSFTPYQAMPYYAIAVEDYYSYYCFRINGEIGGNDTSELDAKITALETKTEYLNNKLIYGPFTCAAIRYQCNGYGAYGYIDDEYARYSTPSLISNGKETVLYVEGKSIKMTLWTRTGYKGYKDLIDSFDNATVGNMHTFEDDNGNNYTVMRGEDKWYIFTLIDHSLAKFDTIANGPVSFCPIISSSNLPTDDTSFLISNMYAYFNDSNQLIIRIPKVEWEKATIDGVITTIYVTNVYEYTANICDTVIPYVVDDSIIYTKTETPSETNTINLYKYGSNYGGNQIVLGRTASSNDIYKLQFFNLASMTK